ncbi:MAG: TIGR02206 family membrane protein [Alphaproteobacteria bacterium]|nr:TIGR02206 family membrane protein [Alphaproteobacteria bacterium]MDE2112259.1 TIGR02206 family membrane protein [Alphaproteobacteria bacterium]MDE2495511.1 TIGR02206 family membrane protein [Alphaproteobacteria bacterium]
MSHAAFEPFVLFGRSHQIVLGLTVAVPLLLSALVRITGRCALTRVICWGFAAAILGAWAYWYMIATRNGWLDLGNALPMDLCSWACIATVVTLIRPNQKSYELAYFWALAGTVQGILRPGIPFDFPDPRFIEFSVFHGGIIASVLFLTVGLKMRPYPSSFPRVIAWTLFYMAAAGAVDWALRVDYGFLRSKPVYPSLFDLMPAWPYYLPVLVVLGLLSMVVYYTPFFLMDRWRAWRS